MTNSGRPVFLVLGAEGRAKAELFDVGEEVLSLDKIVEDGTGGKLDIKARTSVHHQHLTKFLEYYRKRAAILHFAGHAGRGQINTQDYAFSAENLAQLVQSESFPPLKFVFLNACHTSSMAGPFCTVGVDHVIVTTTAVGDSLAKFFAGCFYTAFVLHKKSFLDAFKTAKAAIPEEHGITISHLEAKRAANWSTEQTNDKHWVLYSKPGASDFYLDDLFRDELADEAEAALIPVDNILCKLNRGEQIGTIKHLLFSAPTEGCTKTAALVGGEAHCPGLLLKSLEEDRQPCISLQYEYPTEFSDTMIYYHLRTEGINQRNKWIKRARASTITQLIANCSAKQSPIIISTAIYPKSDKEAQEKIWAHHDFWNSISVAKSKVLALIVVNPIARPQSLVKRLFSRTAKSSFPINGGNVVPSLKTILQGEITDWDREQRNKENDAARRFFRRLDLHRYGEEVKTLATCERGGIYLTDFRTKVNELVAKAIA